MDHGSPSKRAWAVRLAGALGFLALHLRHPVRVASGRGAGSGPFHGPGGLREFWGALESLPSPDAGGNPVPALPAAAGRGLLLLASDLWDAGAVRAALMPRLASGSGVVLLHVLSPEECDPPLAGWLRLRDSESGRAIERYVGDVEREAYCRLLTGWQEEWRRFAAERDARYVPCSTAVPVEEFVTVGLREAGILS